MTNRNNKQIELSKVLINSGFALFDICLFHQELSLGNLKTKLTYLQTQGIIKHLEKDTRKTGKKQRESSVKKQTTVYHAAKELELAFTEQNLKRHETQFLSNKVDTLLRMKSKDFDRCKDVDEESVGRASYVRHINNNECKFVENDTITAKKTKEIPKFLKKKLELTKSVKTSMHDPLQVLMATKQYLEANGKVLEKETHSNKSKYMEHPQNTFSEEHPNILTKNSLEQSTPETENSQYRPRNPTAGGKATYLNIVDVHLISI